MSINYEHPMSKSEAETVAILEDGRRMLVDRQYGKVQPLGRHAATCAQVCRMGGVCDCGMMDGVDVAALVADARDNGLFGAAPVALVTPDAAALAEYDVDHARVVRAMAE